MYYKIANTILYSQLRLPSFSGFLCEESEPDVRLIWTDQTLLVEEGFFTGKFFCKRYTDGWFYYTEDDEEHGLFVSTDYSRLSIKACDPSCLHEREEWLIRIALECYLVRHRCLSLHAACVEWDGAAYAFSGPSGTGKSTRAEAWEKALEAELISGDRPMINVDTLDIYGMPWDGKEKCFRNVQFPLKVIGDVRRSASVYVRSMGFEQRRRLLMRQCFIPMWDTETAILQIANITQLALKAEIVRVFCGPSVQDAVQLNSLLGDENSWLKEEKDMKAKSGFIVRNVVNEYILMPVDDNIMNFNGILLLNEVSAFIWEKLQSSISKEDLLRAVLDEFDVDEEIAAKDLDATLERFTGYGVIEED